MITAPSSSQMALAPESASTSRFLLGCGDRPLQGNQRLSSRCNGTQLVVQLGPWSVSGMAAVAGAVVVVVVVGAVAVGVVVVVAVVEVVVAVVVAVAVAVAAAAAVVWAVAVSVAVSGGAGCHGTCSSHTRYGGCKNCRSSSERGRRTRSWVVGKARPFGKIGRDRHVREGRVGK